MVVIARLRLSGPMAESTDNQHHPPRWPQQATVPVSRRPQVWNRPALTETNVPADGVD